MAENRKKEREAFGKVMTDWFELPGDLVLDLPKITLIGRQELSIENHRGIIECSTNRMRVNLARGYLEIQGKDLEIRSLCSEEIQFIGRIDQLLFFE